MQKSIVEENGKKIIKIKLSSEENWIEDVIDLIMEWTNRKIYPIDFFHFYNRGETITVEKQGYNTSTIEMLLFDIKNFKTKKREEVVKVVYMAMLRRLKSHPIYIVNNLFYHDLTNISKNKISREDKFVEKLNMLVSEEMKKEECHKK